jgi:hypothetical protein
MANNMMNESASINKMSVDNISISQSKSNSGKKGTFMAMLQTKFRSSNKAAVQDSFITSAYNVQTDSGKTKTSGGFDNSVLNSSLVQGTPNDTSIKTYKQGPMTDDGTELRSEYTAKRSDSIDPGDQVFTERNVHLVNR